METLIKSLRHADLETIRSALRATSEGGFFPDWEFEILFGVERTTVHAVYVAWPQQTVDQEEFRCAVLNSLVHLVSYPHGLEEELSSYVVGGRGAVKSALQNLIELDN